MNDRSRELIGYIDVNPRIRELAEQSGCKIDRLGYGEGNLDKFAELIVAECMRECDRSLSKGMLPSDHIREHFGVE